MPTITLTDKELDIVVTALDKLPSADLGADLMIDLMGAILSKKPEDMTAAERAKKKDDDLKRQQEKSDSKQKRAELQKKAELVKAKIIVQREATQSNVPF